jgi:hypothetical protein
MNRSRLLGAMCACLIAFFSASTTAMEHAVHIAKTSSHGMAVDNIAPGDHQIKHRKSSGVERTVFVISAGLIGYYLLRKANNG